jgi:predicted XRE-type DNA-binding protein
MDIPKHSTRGIHARKPITWKIKENGCWECTSHVSTKSENGYHRMRRKYLNAGKIYIHRLIYEECFGEIPEGMDVCHKCDNTHCINPEHLFLGTHTDNMQDMLKKNRGNKAKGEHNSASKLKEKDVLQIIMLLQKGELSQAEIAKKYKVDKTTINKIKVGENWKHLRAVI